MGYDVVAGLMVPGSDAYDVLSAMLARPAWHADAACRTENTAVFFPSNGRSAAAAKAICATCPAFEACREWTDAQGPELDGVWAGTSPSDRRTARRRTSADVTAADHLRLPRWDRGGTPPRMAAGPLS